ncbi:MAG: hypothetical protein AAF761_04260 [Pseudomonadota bacterium]
MRYRACAALALAGALVACGGSDDPATGPGGPGNTGPTGLGSGQVVVEGDNLATRVEFDATNNTLIVESIPFDDDAFEGRYTRTPALDRGTYEAYTSTNGDDTYVAYYDTSTSGSVYSAVLATGDYLDHGFAGATYGREGNVTLPSSTQRVTYSGNYVGLRTTQGNAPGVDTIQGTANLEADFSDNTVRGSITGRTVVAGGTTNQGGTGETSAGTDIVLANGALDRTDGTFTGAANETDGGLGGTGTYEGIVGAGDASEIAGVMIITAGDLRETGSFIATE